MGSLRTLLAGTVLAAGPWLLRPVGATLVSTTYCVAHTDGSLTPWNFWVDDVTNYIYMDLPNTAAKNFLDVYDIIDTINVTGGYAAVANVATIVDSIAHGLTNGTNAGSVVTQFQKVHLWTGSKTLPSAFATNVSIDLFDFNYTVRHAATREGGGRSRGVPRGGATQSAGRGVPSSTSALRPSRVPRPLQKSNGNSAGAHAYIGWSGITPNAAFATGEGQPPPARAPCARWHASPRDGGWFAHSDEPAPARVFARSRRPLCS